ncbi:Benzoate 4-monooxygenase [Cercospora beticola]|uniref:Benzoate 4-monooxygenase n=1 Tax=Cercospora beticola TaxID=122368 RepID=A0A2G5HHX2_CERBT|nr:Benzoate 4-monooxygenase [Cercospora beticola]PIA92186.1 Benzoate 4-monooxygenase [Cercospora beticola]WPB06083.1 hypothetical protein RHO25_010740 [Cercospora beticola]
MSMLPLQTLSYLPWVVLLGSIGWVLYVRFLHPLAGVPGPLLPSLTRLWYVWKIREGSFDEVNRDLHRKYGRLVRIAPNEVSVSDPEAVTLIYGIKSKFTKTNFYPIWKPDAFATKHADQFTDLDEAHHSARRRLLSNIYSMSSVLESEAHVDACTELFMARLSEFAANGKVLDLGTWLQMYAFDIIGELFFGQAFGFLETGSDFGRWIGTLDRLMPVLIVVAMLPNAFRPFYLIFCIMFASTRASLKDFEGVATTAKNYVGRREDMMKSEDIEASASNKRRDILTKLFELRAHRGEKEDFGIADIQQEGYVNILAGSDTTAIAMRAIIHQLLTHPAALNKLMQELEEALHAGRISLPVKFSDALKLPYYSACVKEAMRLHPSVGLGLQRHPLPEGCEIAGRYFSGSKSVRVAINAAVLHYDTDVFGSDAAGFSPERWLAPGAANMERYLLTFGGGSRTCIGKNISLSEIYKMLPHLLLKFKLELAYPEKPLKKSDWWFHKQEGLLVRLSVR